MNGNGNGEAVAPSLTCHVDGCTVKMLPSQARVPSLSAIRQAIGRPVTVETLADHTICKRHSVVAEEEGIRTFPYESSANELSRRVEERAKAGKFFQVYGALKKAGARPSRP